MTATNSVKIMVDDILYLTGLPGAGKSTTIEAFEHHDVATFYTGDVHPETSGKDTLYFGDKHFDAEHEFIAYVVETAVREHNDTDLLVIDSLRSPTELAYVKERDETAHLVAIVCDKNERRSRLEKRNEAMDAIVQREARELRREPNTEFDVGYLIAVADFYINNSSTLDVLYKQINTLITEVHHYGARS